MLAFASSIACRIALTTYQLVLQRNGLILAELGGLTKLTTLEA